MRRPALMVDVVESLWSRPGRAGLACLSIAVGMASLSLLLAMTAGVRAKTRQLVADLGVSVFAIAQPSVEPAATRPVQYLGRRHVECLQAALPSDEVTGVRTYGCADTGLPDGAILLAADVRLCRVRPWRLVTGRLLDDADAGSRCAVISATLARELGLMPGSDLRIRGQPFAVAGVIDVRGTPGVEGTEANSLSPGERVVVVPDTVPPYWLAGESAPRPGLDAVFVRVVEPARFRSALARAQHLFSQPDLRVDPVSWVTPESLVRRWTRYQRAISVAGGSVVLLCLFMGGVTLMSLLLTGVRERMPEIGLRRSLGASRTDIGMLFMGESLCITVGATAIGVLAAGLGLLLVGDRLGLPWAWGAWCIALPLGAGVLLAVAFSYLPARQAAAIQPAEALRSE